MRPALYSQAPDIKSMIKINASKSRQLYLNILAMNSNTFLFCTKNPKIGHKLRVCMHRWESAVLRYHGIGVNYPYPLWGAIFIVLLRAFIRKNYHRNCPVSTLSPLYVK